MSKFVHVWQVVRAPAVRRSVSGGESRGVRESFASSRLVYLWYVRIRYVQVGIRISYVTKSDRRRRVGPLASAASHGPAAHAKRISISQLSAWPSGRVGWMGVLNGNGADGQRLACSSCAVISGDLCPLDAHRRSSHLFTFSVGGRRPAARRAG